MSQNAEPGPAPDAPEPAAAKKPRYVWLAALLAFAALAAAFALAPPGAVRPGGGRRSQADVKREEEIWRQEQQLDEGRGVIYNKARPPVRR
jgi:hypothetical protein